VCCVSKCVWPKNLNTEAVYIRTRLLRHSKKETEVGVLKSNMKHLTFLSFCYVFIDKILYNSFACSLSSSCYYVHNYVYFFLICCTKFTITF
jgi:hypothetical protein